MNIFEYYYHRFTDLFGKIIGVNWARTQALKLLNIIFFMNLGSLYIYNEFKYKVFFILSGIFLFIFSYFKLGVQSDKWDKNSWNLKVNYFYDVIIGIYLLSSILILSVLFVKYVI